MNDNQILTKFGINLKAERVRQGLTQEDLAEKADISHSQSVGEIERGEVNTSLVRVIKILKALNLKFEKLYDINNDN